ncbi:conserved Plasmodium protein, unknown function [Plasmodium ovale curtisi]|uniref:THH1/TOM1/TOM3 domain-containing protein n=1 Tax=Plasmodium ovale curtisi TaxID=864141 RepID=A0A1A8VND3_PLAOA|nr:conserved Plasmodium protein, unknown function [Plasmodium ovale curtisi]SBS84857.1 conserved Plasmodium protein, unknown function [Plasmodium ovale curtisi]
MTAGIGTKLYCATSIRRFQHGDVRGAKKDITSTSRRPETYLPLAFATLFLCVSKLPLIQTFNKKQQSLTHSLRQLDGGTDKKFFVHFSLFLSHKIASLIILTYLDIRYGEIDYNTLLLFPNFYFYLILLKTAPTYLFLSSFTIIILFWSQVYYASILVSTPHLQSFYVLVNVVVHVANFVFACLAYFTRAFYDYIYYNYILESVIDYLISVAFLYYGLKVTNKLREKSKGNIKKSSIIKRVTMKGDKNEGKIRRKFLEDDASLYILSLAIIMFIILSLKGIYSFWCFVKDANFSSSYFDLPTCDAIVYFLSECIPSVLIIYTFQSHKEKNTLHFEHTTPLCSEAFDPYNMKFKKRKTKKMDV